MLNKKMELPNSIINLKDATINLNEEKSLPNNLPYNTNVNIFYATNKEKHPGIDFVNKYSSNHIKTDEEKFTPNEFCKMIEDNVFDDNKLRKMIDDDIKKIKKEKTEKEIKSDYSFGTLPNFAKDNEINYYNSFIIFPTTKIEKDSDKRFNISVSDFVRENWDISINYNHFNNFPPLLRDKDFTIKDMQCYFLVNNMSCPTYVTLPNASDYPHYWNHKEIILKNLHNQPIYSKHNNIQQLKTLEISNKILSAESKGKYITLITNGNNWVIKSIF